MVDLGMGRGGDCQFLSLLFAEDPLRFSWNGKRGMWGVEAERVVGFRAKVAEWLERREKVDLGAGVSVCGLILSVCARDNMTWQRYLDEVRGEGWGDHFTLLAAAGVLRRKVQVTSMSRGEGDHEVYPDAAWEAEAAEGCDLFLAHVSEVHYCPLVGHEVMRRLTEGRQKEKEEGRAESIQGGRRREGGRDLGKAAGSIVGERGRGAGETRGRGGRGEEEFMKKKGEG